MSRPQVGNVQQKRPAEGPQVGVYVQMVLRVWRCFGGFGGVVTKCDMGFDSDIFTKKMLKTVEKLKLGQK